MGSHKTGPNEAVTADISDYFHPTPVDDEGLILADGALRVCFVPVPHVPRQPAFGILIELDPENRQSAILRWSGDKTFEASSVLFDDLNSRAGDLVFHDCNFSPFYDLTVHSHYEELLKLPEEVRRTVVLIHHGRVEDEPKDYGAMVLGQPFQRFSYQWGQNR